HQLAHRPRLPLREVRLMMRLHSRGMTMIEMLVAMAVLAIGLLGISALQIVSANMNQMSQRMAIATALATDLIENVSLWQYSDARLSTTTNITSTADPSVAASSILVSG